MQALKTRFEAYWMTRSACKRLIGSTNEKSCAIAMMTHLGKRTHEIVNYWQKDIFCVVPVAVVWVTVANAHGNCVTRLCMHCNVNAVSITCQCLDSFLQTVHMFLKQTRHAAWSNEQDSRKGFGKFALLMVKTSACRTTIRLWTSMAKWTSRHLLSSMEVL